LKGLEGFLEEVEEAVEAEEAEFPAATLTPNTLLSRR